MVNKILFIQTGRNLKQIFFFFNVFALLRKGALKKNFLRRNIDIKKGSPQIQIKSHIYNVIRDD